MAVSIRGYPGVVRVRSEITFDPTLGDGIMEWWAGSKTAVFAMHRFFKGLGYRCSVRNNGTRWECQIFIGKSEEDEAAQDRWSFDKDFVQVSIFALPWIAAEADHYVSRAQYRKDLEDAVKKGEDNPLDKANFPLSQGIYEDLSRGIEAYEVERVVLRRQRTFSFVFPSRIVLQALPVVYSSATLISTFKIPKVIADQFPVAPPQGPADPKLTPTGTVWAWKTRHDSSDQIPYLNKIQEMKEWVFAAWSTHYYKVL